MIYPIYRTNNPVSNDYDPSLPIGFGWWEVGSESTKGEDDEDEYEPEIELE